MVEIGLARLMRECQIGRGAVLGFEHCGERGLEPGFAVHVGQVVEAQHRIERYSERRTAISGLRVISIDDIPLRYESKRYTAHCDEGAS